MLFEAKAVIEAKPLSRALPHNPIIETIYEANRSFALKSKLTALAFEDADQDSGNA